MVVFIIRTGKMKFQQRVEIQYPNMNGMTYRDDFDLTSQI